jgi:hypothetical protein
MRAQLYLKYGKYLTYERAKPNNDPQAGADLFRSARLGRSRSQLVPRSQTQRVCAIRRLAISVVEAQPREGREKMGHGVSRGLARRPSSPYPIPLSRGAGETKGRGGYASQGSRYKASGQVAPCATIFRPASLRASSIRQRWAPRRSRQESILHRAPQRGRGALSGTMPNGKGVGGHRS